MRFSGFCALTAQNRPKYIVAKKSKPPKNAKNRVFISSGLKHLDISSLLNNKRIYTKMTKREEYILEAMQYPSLQLARMYMNKKHIAGYVYKELKQLFAANRGDY